MVTGEKHCFGGGGEGLLFAGFAFGLQKAEFGYFPFAAARETILLQVEIPYFLFVIAADREFEFADDRCANMRNVRFFFESGTIMRNEGHFQGGDAVETPADIGNGLDESLLFGTDGLELGFVIAEVVGVLPEIVAVEEDGVAGECGFEGVETGVGQACQSSWTRRFEGVGAVGRETGGGGSCVVAAATGVGFSDIWVSPLMLSRNRKARDGEG